MSILHTLNKTAHHIAVNEKLSQVINEDDSVVLIENGVYQCVSTFSDASTKKSWPQLTKHIFALKEDALARGVSIDTQGISFISYEEFVTLSLSHNKVVSWYS